jgi:maltooligosyltrehalose trehalohydrolase
MHDVGEVKIQRTLPVGAEVQSRGVHFRVWAPHAENVAVHFGAGGDHGLDATAKLESEGNAYWSALVPAAAAGMRYVIDLDGERLPDPASRFQPEGPHKPSQIIDPAFDWTDRNFPGVGREGQVVYEMHIGTFSTAGTWQGARRHLPHLAQLGVTVLEVMPVADFPGRYGWGYDGVNPFAPTRLYGSPDDFRQFVDDAHGHGLGVILDVVYNHLGPDGNFASKFTPHYFTARHRNDWGEALNFYGEDSAPVREYFISNAGYWIREFHLDGLRLDATQQIFDFSEPHVLAEITAHVRDCAGSRKTYVIAENEPQHARLARRRDQGGFGIDALWNDDFHHSAIVAMTGRQEAYYTDYRGSPQEFVSAAKWGFLYQGQRYKWQKARRGTPCLDLTPASFVCFLQNHDQVANSLWGRRIHQITSSGRLRALTALLLLGPNTPMLFQGQEFAANSPFLYFADHNPELAAMVARGREEFLSQFPSIASVDIATLLPNPELEDTFLRCKLDFADCEKHADVLRLHTDLIRLRRETELINHAVRGSYDGAVLNEFAFVLRYFGRQHDDRLLAINLGPHAHIDPAPEPLLAPPEGFLWEVIWSSEDPTYGGGGTPPVDSDNNWQLPAESAILMAPERSSK